MGWNCKEFWNFETALVYCTESFRNEIDKNKYVVLALLDLSKAFDSFQYNILEKKLFDLGFDGPPTRTIIDFTSNRIQKVCVNNTSEKIELYQGKPQGTVPVLLFLKLMLTLT